MPTGVHGSGPALPSTSLPRFIGCSPSTSLSGSTRDSSANSSSPVGCWTRKPVQAGSAFSSSIRASTSAWVAVAGRSTRIDSIPISAQSLCLPPTYQCEPGSSPTSTVPSPGTTPRSRSAATRLVELVLDRRRGGGAVQLLCGHAVHPVVGRVRRTRSVGEVAGAGEVHGHAGGLAAVDDLVVADRAARLRRSRATPASMQDLRPVVEREERVGRRDRAPRPAPPPASPRAGRSRPG